MPAKLTPAQRAKTKEMRNREREHRRDTDALLALARNAEPKTNVRFVKARTLNVSGNAPATGVPAAVVAGWTGLLPNSLAAEVLADGSAVAAS